MKYKADQDKLIRFMKTDEPYGGLSNMCNMPIVINGITIKNSEALYQACRFPLNKKIQKRIIEASNGYSSKLISRKYTKRTRDDWYDVNVRIMYWCLRVKLIQNINVFGQLLIDTGTKDIVEHSYKDAFWGAKLKDGYYVGNNILGKLLMRLRERLLENKNSFYKIKPLDIPDFKLYDKKIKRMSIERLKV